MISSFQLFQTVYCVLIAYHILELVWCQRGNDGCPSGNKCIMEIQCKPHERNSIVGRPSPCGFDIRLNIWMKICCPDLTPDPPTNLSVSVLGGKVAEASWEPPRAGAHTGYKLSVVPRSEKDESPPRNHYISQDAPFLLRELTPGTAYEVQLFSVFHGLDSATFLATNFTTTPDPPTNLSVSVLGGKVAEVSWEPPRAGGYTGYKLSVVPRSEKDESPPRNHYISQDAPFLLRELTPGAAYEVQLFSVFHGQDSATFLATNFTTKPNTPGLSIVWFRNETTLVVLWQPPYPSGVFDRYRVGVAPEDAARSQLLVAKEGDPLGPSQAAFYGLVPGRAYKISVQTVSGDQESEPTIAQYRTVPLPPVNVTWDPDRLSSVSFDVRWEPPTGQCEFDRYQVALDIRNTVRYVVAKEEKRVVIFDDALNPGETYKVVVKTVSGNVASWPATANITTRPLPVTITSTTSDQVGEISLSWEPAKNSTQDSYEIKYNDMEAFNSGGSLLVVSAYKRISITLTPGRNYSVSVSAISKRIPSESVTVYQLTN